VFSFLLCLRLARGSMARVPAVNRLDRLTSGLMIIGLTSACAKVLSTEFIEGRIKKEYIARCAGEFPECVFIRFAIEHAQANDAHEEERCWWTNHC